MATTTEPVATAPPPGGVQRILAPTVRYGKSFGIGAAFAVGWTPCIGPILGAILTAAATTGTALQGTFLLTAWSLGLGVPFLLAGLMLGTAMKAIKRIRPLMPALEVAGGVLVIFIGALIFLDEFTIFNQYFTGTADLVTDAESNVEVVSATSVFGFAVAFMAGFVAFLSPCTLPMVPAYLMHLAGVSSAEDVDDHRGVTFRHSVAFVGGFTVLFVVLGAAAGAVGFAIEDHMQTIQKAAGVLLIVLGLNLIGILRIPWLYRTYQFEFPPTTGG